MIIFLQRVSTRKDMEIIKEKTVNKWIPKQKTLQNAGIEVTKSIILEDINKRTIFTIDPKGSIWEQGCSLLKKPDTIGKKTGYPSGNVFHGY